MPGQLRVDALVQLGEAFLGDDPAGGAGQPAGLIDVGSGR